MGIDFEHTTKGTIILDNEMKESFDKYPDLIEEQLYTGETFCAAGAQCALSGLKVACYKEGRVGDSVAIFCDSSQCPSPQVVRATAARIHERLVNP